MGDDAETNGANGNACLKAGAQKTCIQDYTTTKCTVLIELVSYHVLLRGLAVGMDK